MSKATTWPVASRGCRLALWLLVLWLASGCRTALPFGHVDLREPGWTLQKGQAIWTPKAGAPELAGDLLIARHADGRSFVQFSKVPFPSVTAWRHGAAWQIEYQPQNRRHSARSHPPARCLMLHVVPAMLAQDLPPALQMDPVDTAGLKWRLWNRRTGESLAADLSP